MATDALQQLMQQAQDMQKRMQDAQQDLINLIVEGHAGEGRMSVAVKMNGKHEVVSVSIDESLLDDKELLEDLVAAACNSAVQKIEKAAQKKMQELTSNIQLPEGLDLGNLTGTIDDE